jgi:hypothetical protein
MMPSANNLVRRLEPGRIAHTSKSLDVEIVFISVYLTAEQSGGGDSFIWAQRLFTSSSL